MDISDGIFILDKIWLCHKFHTSVTSILQIKKHKEVFANIVKCLFY